MDFKKFISDAGTSLNRAVQKTQESFGNVDKTEYDSDLEKLMIVIDNTKKWSEKIVEHLEAKLQPNPAVRMEEFICDKIEKKVDKPKPADILGETLKNAGEELGGNSAYGSALIKCGRSETRLATAEKQYIHQVSLNILIPMRKFVKEDLAVLTKERATLEDYRLDLDSAKSKLRKAKQEAAKKTDDETVTKAEEEVHNAQLRFNQHCQVVKKLMETATECHAYHLKCLKEYVECQVAYHNQCSSILKDLKVELGN